MSKCNACANLEEIESRKRKWRQTDVVNYFLRNIFDFVCVEIQRIAVSVKT